MDRVIQNVEAQDLGGSEINTMLRGKAEVKLFDSLRNATVTSFFTMPAVALLFPVQSLTQGHWLALLIDPEARRITHFDPYGFGLAMEEKYTQNPLVREGLLSTFYQNAADSGYQVVFNQTKFQQLENSMNTCGRHVITRIRLSYLTGDEYTKLLTGQKMAPDDIVTYLTFLALNEDQSDKAQIQSTLSRVASASVKGGGLKQDPSATASAPTAPADDPSTEEIKASAAQAAEDWSGEKEATEQARWRTEDQADDDAWDEEWFGKKSEIADTKPAREMPYKRINIDSGSETKRQKGT